MIYIAKEKNSDMTLCVSENPLTIVPGRKGTFDVRNITATADVTLRSFDLNLRI